LLVETKPSVDSQNLIVLLDEVVARSDHAERVFLTDIALETEHADVRVLIDEPLVVAGSLRLKRA